MKTLYILIIILIIFFTAIAGIIYLNNKSIACTEDARICPDGTAVGRTGPDCEFEKCPGEDKKTYCTDEQREKEACIEIYQPVCGWANENIKCLKYPCASTYQNYCFACLDKNVEYYTQEECPDKQIVGGETDEHGCILMAGYTWNKTKQECVREWEETLKDVCADLGCGENMLFAGSKNSDKYYNCDCGWAKTINPENLICFSSDEQAFSDGRIKSEC